MNLSNLISEVGLELDRSDIDTRIKRWLQQSIDYVYTIVTTKKQESSASLTATTDTETITLPLDFGELLELRYTPGDGSGFQLRELSSGEFFLRNADQQESGYPYEFCIFGSNLHLHPLPSSTHSYTLTYRQESANIYLHTLSITDSDNAATTGVQLYLDEDAVSTGVGKFYFVSPTATDAVLELASADGHVHLVTVYHSATAATLGVAVYFDEDGGTTADRLLFVSPTNINCFVQTEKTKGHSHYVKIADADGAASTGVGVYIDEDAANKAQRALFVSPTNADGTSEVVLSLDETVPPFAEQYHEAIFLGAISRGLRFDKKYGEANNVAKQADILIGALVVREDRKRPVSISATPFSSRGRSSWDAWRFPEIDT